MGLHRGQFAQGRRPRGGIFGAMLLRQLFQQIGSLQNDTAPRRRSRKFTEIAKEFGIVERLAQGSGVMNGIGGHLNDGTGFDVTPGADMVREAGGCGAQSLSLSVVIGVNEDDGFLRAHRDNELSCPALLLGSQAQVGVGIWSDRPVDVKPGVKDSHFNQPIDPAFGEQVIKICLAQAGADARQQLMLQAIL